jgi:hypothetical protein
MNKDILVAADDHEGGLCLPKSSARLTQESESGTSTTRRHHYPFLLNPEDKYTTAVPPSLLSLSSPQRQPTAKP